MYLDSIEVSLIFLEWLRWRCCLQGVHVSGQTERQGDSYIRWYDKAIFGFAISLHVYGFQSTSVNYYNTYMYLPSVK